MTNPEMNTPGHYRGHTARYIVILFVGIIASLMAGDVILPAEGLPIITAIVGFTLGRQFRSRNRGEKSASG